MVMPQYQQQSEGVIRLKLISNDILNQLKHTLSGDVWDADKEEFVEDENKEPMLNPKGVNYIISIVASLNSRDVRLSNLDEKMIRQMALDTENQITDVLFLKKEEFDVDLSYASTIVNTVGNLVLSSLYRALNGFEQEKMKDIARVHETQQIIPPEKKVGMFGKFYAR